MKKSSHKTQEKVPLLLQILGHDTKGTHVHCLFGHKGKNEEI